MPNVKPFAHKTLHKKNVARRRFRAKLNLESLEDRLCLTGNASGTIMGLAFVDANANGSFDSGEAGLSGATITLAGTTGQGNAVSQSVVTDADGKYSFLNVLPGTYQVSGESAAYVSSQVNANLILTGGEIKQLDDLAFRGLSAQFVSMRQFLNNASDEDFLADPGSGETLANYRENNHPEAVTPSDVNVGRNTTVFVDPMSLFTDPDFTESLIRFETSKGSIDVKLYDSAAPQTVANFFNYILSDRYDNAIFHRSDPGFVLQGGAVTFSSGTSSLINIPQDPSVENEFGASNTKGTIAMAKVPGDPNSATSQFFFNLGNNTDLDTQNDGFTVFGEIVDAGDQAVIDALAALPTHDLGGAFDEIPLANYSGTNFPTDTTAANYALISDVVIVQRDEFLSFEVIDNDNPGVVTATIDQNRISLVATNTVGEANITVRATDRFGATVEITFKAVVENTAPTATVTLDTNRPLEDSILTATVEANDPNGDDVTLSYVWKVNDTVVKQTENVTGTTDTLDLSDTSIVDIQPGDVITVQVIPSDGSLDGPEVSAAATVDRPPTTTGIADQTFSGTGSFELDVTSSFSDPDNDALTYTATLTDSSPLPDWLTMSADGILSGNPGVNDEASLDIRVTATDGSGLAVSTAFNLDVSNTPSNLNDVPIIVDAVLAPSSPTTGDTLTALVEFVDGDAVSVLLSYVWKVNGNQVRRVDDSTSTVDALTLEGLVVAGDTVSLEITPSDGIVSGTTVTKSVVIG